jgi:hypothetical protein
MEMRGSKKGTERRKTVAEGAKSRVDVDIEINWADQIRVGEREFGSSLESADFEWPFQPTKLVVLTRACMRMS